MKFYLATCTYLQDSDAGNSKLKFTIEILLRLPQFVWTYHRPGLPHWFVEHWFSPEWLQAYQQCWWIWAPRALYDTTFHWGDLGHSSLLPLPQNPPATIRYPSTIPGLICTRSTRRGGPQSAEESTLYWSTMPQTTHELFKSSGGQPVKFKDQHSMLTFGCYVSGTHLWEKFTVSAPTGIGAGPTSGIWGMTDNNGIKYKVEICILCTTGNNICRNLGKKVLGCIYNDKKYISIISIHFSLYIKL